MHTHLKLIFVFLALSVASTGAAQTSQADQDKEELKIAALEALMSVPAERALPIVIKVLDGDNSDDLKESALFILSQIDHPDATVKLLEFAHNGDGETQLEAIRMIGINGEDEAMAGLIDIYSAGDEDVREAVLEAYLIADDVEGVFNVAMNTQSEDEYEEAVAILAAMDAHEALSRLREAKGPSDALITAYIISDNDAELRKLALDGSDIELQIEAIQALGIVGANDADTVLVEIYRSTESEDIKEAALEGLFIGDFDDAVLALYRASNDVAEKRELLEALVIMDSDSVMEVIEEALAGDQ